MKKLAIIGASYLQEPLIQKAKERHIETHVFAWQCGDVGEKSADYFYPISIVEKDAILKKCMEIGIDGICTIASDLAVITVNYVATKMGLVSNSMETCEISTNKHLMRKCFEENGDPSPKSILVESIKDLDTIDLEYPVIVKPIDRSGSRGITKLENAEGLENAIENAKAQGFIKKALVEEFAQGQEYSVEYISWQGKHYFLSVTQKYTTGSPNFIETGHMEPAMITEDILERVKSVVSHALTSLNIQFGASHSELKISASGEIKLIEIGGRMGGDFIGSHLVELSTGYDFISGVIDVALGKEPVVSTTKKSFAGVHFIFSQSDIDTYNQLLENDSQMLVASEIKEISNVAVTDSGSRFGYFLFADQDFNRVLNYLPKQEVME